MPKKILQNLALIDLINFCKANNLDPSGTHIVKYNPRKWIYALCRDKDDHAIATVLFSPNQVPTHSINNN